jgi:hypothetical protein
MSRVAYNLCTVQEEADTIFMPGNDAALARAIRTGHDRDEPGTARPGRRMA